jgi:hypothetical protein
MLVALDTIPGVDRKTATIVADTGGDMSRFPSAAQLWSWAAMCPGQKESAGKRRSGKTRKGNRYLRAALIQGALARYLSMRYADRIADAGIAPSVGSPRRLLRQRARCLDPRPLQDRGDSSTQPVAASRSRRIRDARLGGLVNHRRLLKPIGYVPPAGYEARYYEQTASVLTHITHPLVIPVRFSRIHRNVEADQPRDLLSLDTFYFNKLKSVVADHGPRCRLVVRLGAAHPGRGDGGGALGFLREVVRTSYRQAGWRLRRVLTDNGSK